MAGESSLRGFLLVTGFALLLGIAVVGAGAIAFVRWSDSSFDTKWNDRYSQPTFPLDDDPATVPDPKMWATP